MLGSRRSASWTRSASSPTSATSAMARLPSVPWTTPRSPSEPKRIGLPCSRRIWFVDLRLLVRQQVEGPVVEDVAVLVDLDEGGPLVSRSAPKHVGQVCAIDVERPSHEARLGSERQRERVERLVERTERRRLRHLADLARRRVLALRQTVDLVVEEQDLERHVPPQRVNQVVPADRERVTVAGDDPDAEIRARDGDSGRERQARGRECRASRTCSCSTRSGPSNRCPATKTTFSGGSPSSGMKPATAFRIA